MVHRDYGVFEFDVHGLRELATDALCVLAFKTGTDRVRQLVTLEEVAEATSADIVLLTPEDIPDEMSATFAAKCYMAPEAELFTATGAEYGIDAVALAVAA